MTEISDTDARVADARVAHAPTTVPPGSIRHYLMCRPDHFTVSYRINPWMHPTDPTDTSRAVHQWQALHDLFVSLGHRVELIDALEGLPDMVYAANGGFTLDGIAYGARFVHEQRVAEGPAYQRWFADHGFRVVEPRFGNEGEGDFMLAGDTILAGTGFRSTRQSHAEVAEIFGREVLSLTLVDPRFYHLDTALAVLDPAPSVLDPGGVSRASGTASAPAIAYLPDAFDKPSRTVLAERFPDAIIVDRADAAVLGLNSISDGRNVVISPRATGFARQLREHGYNPVGVDLSELLLGGGGVKCCTLELRL